jgi:hypothetical protein
MSWGARVKCFLCPNHGRVESTTASAQTAAPGKPLVDHRSLVVDRALRERLDFSMNACRRMIRSIEYLRRYLGGTSSKHEQSNGAKSYWFTAMTVAEDFMSPEKEV